LTQELLAQKKQIMVCGDVNTAHEAIDLARPKQNEKNTGFLPWERSWVSDYLAAGMVDVWRARHENEVAYTWWDYKTAARARNVGWRIDYFFCNKKLLTRVEDCTILSEVLGSDHAPVQLLLKP
jgi:exodeoxyribonuclease-3